MIRLLNIHTMKLESFHKGVVPPYAVASHRWQKDETTYEKFTQGLETQSPGHTKIEKFCLFMRQRAKNLEDVLGQSLNWLWIDTCCIKKTDLNELSEAVNSMFDWYASAHICLAYLFDVAKEDAVVQSSWFTRGWTLQELLAPSLVLFMDNDWQVRGHKNDIAFRNASVYDILASRLGVSAWLGPRLNTKISERTGIPSSVLTDFALVESVSFKEILDWMNSRSTTRWEDQAYCLLGIVDVSMPLNYGEQEHAMIRLLEQMRDKSAKRLQNSRYDGKPGKSEQAITEEIAQLDKAIADWNATRAERRKQGRKKPQARCFDASLESSSARYFNELLAQYNAKFKASQQATTALEKLEKQKAKAFWNPLESTSNSDATS